MFAVGSPTVSAGPVAPLRTAPPAGDRTLFLSDLRLGVLVLNEVRYRAFARLFGISREQANVVSLIALMLVVERLRAQIDRLKVGGPSSGDTVLAAATVREALCDVAGPASRTTPWTGTLLMIAILGGGRPAMKKAAQGARTKVHRSATSFHRRYGWLVDPGHLRQRRARGRA